MGRHYGQTFLLDWAILRHWLILSPESTGPWSWKAGISVEHLAESKNDLLLISSWYLDSGEWGLIQEASSLQRPSPPLVDESDLKCGVFMEASFTGRVFTGRNVRSAFQKPIFSYSIPTKIAHVFFLGGWCSGGMGGLFFPLLSLKRGVNWATWKSNLRGNKNFHKMFELRDPLKHSVSLRFPAKSSG